MKRGRGFIADPPLRMAGYRHATYASPYYPLAKSLDHARPPVLDQGPTASCVGHGTSTLLAMAAKLWAVSIPVASPRALYRDARAMTRRDDHEPLIDVGTYPSAAVDALEYCGIYPLDTAESDISEANVNDEATLTELAVQRKRLIVSPTIIVLTDYTTVANIIKMKIANNEPVGLGVLIGDEWPSWGGTGIIPAPHESTPLGGHWIACDSYETSRDTLVLRGLNSWGTAWGDKGEWRASLRDMFDSGRLLQALSFGPPSLVA